MTSLLLALLTCVAGGVGASARWWCDAQVQVATGGRHPWGTFVVNVVGSFLLGVVVALAGDGGAWTQVLGLGLLGGYTTFSSSVVQSVRATTSEGLALGAVHAVATAVACVSAALIGLQLG